MKKNVNRTILISLIFSLFFGSNAYAYLGPGLGLIGIGVIIVIFVIIIIYIIAIIYYPLKKIYHKFFQKKDEK